MNREAEWDKELNAFISNFEKSETSGFTNKHVFTLENNFDEILETIYIEEQHRLRSFECWMITDVSKEKLACAGFYHIKEDHVKCFACNVVISNWCRGDDPFIEHIKHSSDCPFIKGEQTNNSPINEETLKKELSELRRPNSKANQTPKQINDLDSQNEILHPGYKTVEQRMKTFEKWPKGLNQTPLELSRAGFFYLGTSDEVKCFYCGKCLKQWQKADKPDKEHKRHFWKTCRFIRDFYSLNENNSNHKSSVKASTPQINYLIEYMDSNQDFANGVINVSNDKSKFHSMWNNLTEKLNGLGPAYKPAHLWREVWRNVKYNRKKDRKRPHSSISSESCNSNSHDDCWLQQNSSNRASEILVLDCNTNAMQPYHANFSSVELEKLKLEKEIKTLEIAKIELELKIQLLGHNKS